ncbi:MAG TPA: YndJ family transporter [Saprospiraceae bacterium]|nr:YndJ family transporter [Saprospiraceae bacterium]HMQ83557.1 YndJ family transporter [Saprospiraceae bacterium]
METLHRLPSIAFHLLLGILALVILFTAGDFSSTIAPTYLYFILLFCPLLLLPLSWKIVSQHFPALKTQHKPFQAFWVAAVCFYSNYAFAFKLPILVFAIPYLTLSVYLFLKIFQQATIPFSIKVAFGSIPIATVWALADRLALQPLGFNPIIVLLTAIHFHYAGFVLGIILGLLMQKLPLNRLAYAHVIGVVGVAAGITLTQLALTFWLEIISASILGIVGIIIALHQGSHALKTRSVLAKCCFISGSLALIFGMMLAILYSWRFHHHAQWLTIPFMYSMHGVANSIGFALLSLLGWSLDEGYTDTNSVLAIEVPVYPT